MLVCHLLTFCLEVLIWCQQFSYLVATNPEYWPPGFHRDTAVTFLSGVGGQDPFEAIEVTPTSLIFDLSRTLKDGISPPERYDVLYGLRDDYGLSEVTYHVLESNEDSRSVQSTDNGYVNIRLLRPGSTYDVCFRKSSAEAKEKCRKYQTERAISPVRALSPTKRNATHLVLSWMYPKELLTYHEDVCFDVTCHQDVNDVVHSWSRTKAAFNFQAKNITANKIAVAPTNTGIFSLCVTTVFNDISSNSTCIKTTLDPVVPMYGEDKWTFDKGHEVHIFCEPYAMCKENFDDICTDYPKKLTMSTGGTTNSLQINGGRDKYCEFFQSQNTGAEYSALFFSVAEEGLISVGKIQDCAVGQTNSSDNKGKTIVKSEETSLYFWWTRNPDHFGSVSLILDTNASSDLIQRKNFYGCTFTYSIHDLPATTHFNWNLIEEHKNDGLVDPNTGVRSQRALRFTHGGIINTKSVCQNVLNLRWITRSFDFDSAINPNIEWELPESEQGPIEKFMVVLQGFNFNNTSELQCGGLVGTNRCPEWCSPTGYCSASLNGTELEPVSNYQLSVSCKHFNSMSWGQASQTAFRTKSSVPTRVSGVALLSISKDVLWSDPRDEIELKINLLALRHIERKSGKIIKLEARYSEGNFRSVSQHRKKEKEVQFKGSRRQDKVLPAFKKRSHCAGIKGGEQSGELVGNIYYRHIEKEGLFRLCQLNTSYEYKVRLRYYNEEGYADSEILKFRTPESGKADIFIIIIVVLLFGLVTYYIFTADLDALECDGSVPSIARSDFAKDAGLRVPIKLSELEEKTAKLIKNDDLLSAEYLALVKASPTYPSVIASRNEDKNRYFNISPFDHSRVVLSSIAGDYSSAYINASYIDGFDDKECLFIAGQGPLENTVGDFWRMIWERNVKIIVMLTRCFEGSKAKCHQYWPPPNQFSIWQVDDKNLNVRTMSETVSGDEDFILRSLILSKDETERKVYQFHFVTWPDFKSPQDPDQMIRFTSKVRKYVRDDRHHIVVHCSAGVGRSGTFIGLYNLMDEIEQDFNSVEEMDCQEFGEKTIDIAATVSKMRHFRCNMVQTKVQYAFLYQCVCAFYKTLTEKNKTESTLEDNELGQVCHRRNVERGELDARTLSKIHPEVDQEFSDDELKV